MTNEEYSELSLEDKEKAIQQYLDYLLSEGIVVKKKNGKYRMKTQKEIEKEIQNIYNS